MRKQKLITALGASVGMLILILDSKTAMSGAAEGVSLCIRTLIPSLFPFFVLSILLTGALTGQTFRLLRPIGKLCSIPAGAESLLAVGLLGGYPVGAQNVCLAYRRGQISKQDAERLMVFCNNAGPAFLFGILGPMFSSKYLPWLLWGIHMLSAIVVGAVLPGCAAGKASIAPSGPVSVIHALEKAVRTMALVCGWVVLFRMILAVLERWLFWLLPLPVQVLIAGILELSNGCIRLASMESEGIRFLLAGIMLALGGFCVTLQTASISSGISLRLYFPGKLLQCAVSILLIIGLHPVLSLEISHAIWLSTGLLSAILIIILRKTKKTSSFPAAVGV